MHWLFIAACHLTHAPGKVDLLRSSHAALLAVQSVKFYTGQGLISLAI